MGTFGLAVLHKSVNVSDNTDFRVTMFHGRRTSYDPIRGRTCQISLYWGDGSLNPNTFQVNDTVIIRATTPAVAPTYTADFTFDITDVSVDRRYIRLTGIDRNYSRLGRSELDLPAYTNQPVWSVIDDVLDRAFAAGIITANYSAGTDSVSTVTTTAGTYNALQFLQAVANSEPLGMLAMSRTNSPLFLSYNAFRDSNSNFSTPTFDYSARTRWAYEWELQRSTADFVNTAVVNYTGGTETYADPVSVTAVGAYERVVTTVLGSATDAAYYARRLVSFGTAPGYRISELTLDLTELANGSGSGSLGQNWDLMRPGRLLKTPTVYPSGPTQWVVQGVTDSINYSATARDWFRTHYVVDRFYYDAAQRWQDVTSGVKWSTVNGTYKWTDLERYDI